MTKSHHQIRRSRLSAFSLMEMSIVLLIMSAVIGAGFTMTNKQNQLEKIKTTNANLDKIEAALLSFRVMNNRLPCPADASMTPSNANYGVEAASGSSGAVVNCAGVSPAVNFSGAQNANVEGTPNTGVVGGMVPLVALGLNESDVLDGWGNKITYHVDSKATLASAFTTYPLSSDKCFDITVDDNTTSSAGSDRAYHMLHGIYILVSHGADGHGAYSVAGSRINTASPNAGTYSTFQNANADFNAAGSATQYNNLFYDVPAGENATNSKDRYDDYVRYKSRSQLRTEQDGPATFMPDLVINSNTGGFSQYQMNFYYRCDKQFRKEVPWISSGTTSFGLFGAAISPNNKRILTGLFGNPLFLLWNFDGKTATNVPANTSYYNMIPDNVGSTATGQIVDWISDDAFLVNATDDTDFTAARRARVMIYEEDTNNPNHFTLKEIPFPAGSTGDLPTNSAADITLSPDKNEALFTVFSIPTTPTLFSRNSGNNSFTWVQYALNPTPAGTTQAYNRASWAPNMAYLAIPVANDAEEMLLYRNDGNHTYNEITPPSPTPSYDVQFITWTPDARFMATGGSSTSWNIYERVGDTFTGIASMPAALPNNAKGMSFSQDGRFLAVITSAATTNNLLIYERAGNTFTLLASPNGPTAYPETTNKIVWRNLMNWERRELQ